MQDEEFQKELEKLKEKVIQRNEAVFKKYDAIPSQGLDKQGEHAELKKVWDYMNTKMRELRKKYGIREAKHKNV